MSVTVPKIENLSPEEIAAQMILRLINESPRSPRQDEIEAIVAKVAPASQQRLPALAPDHLDYRRLIAEAKKQDDEGIPDGEDGDAAVEALQSKIMALERKIWSTPARTLADVLLRGEIALHNENGIMDSLNDAEAYYDERANAQLIRAVVDVLGGRHA